MICNMNQLGYILDEDVVRKGWSVCSQSNRLKCVSGPNRNTTLVIDCDLNIVLLVEMVV